MNRMVSAFIFSAILTACGGGGGGGATSSATDSSDYPSIAGRYSFNTDQINMSCSDGSSDIIPALALNFELTQDVNVVALLNANALSGIPGITFIESTDLTGNVQANSSFIINQISTAYIDGISGAAYLNYNLTGSFYGNGWSGSYTYSISSAESGSCTFTTVFTGSKITAAVQEVSEGKQASCFDLPDTAYLTCSTWTVSDDLSRTLGDDILKSMQPAPAANDASETAYLLKSYIQTKLMDALGVEGEAHAATGYTNALDLIEKVIANDEVANFTAGREMITSRANLNIPARYNNKNVTVRHTDGRTPMSFLVDYNYSGDSDTNGIKYITRTLWEFSRSGESKAENPVDATSLEFNSSLSLTTYRADLFSATGYLQPSTVIATWSNSSGSDVSIYKDYDQEFNDTSEYVSANSFTLDETLGSLKRIKIRVSYQTGIAEVFVSEFISAYAVINMNDEVTDVILKDITPEELDELFVQNPEWKGVLPYNDPGYDGEAATPLTTYTATLLLHRS